MLRLLRIGAMVGLLGLGLAVTFFWFPLASQASKTAWVRRWSRWALRACGVALRVSGSNPLPSLPGALVLANHVSWLDIFVFNATHPVTFVAKSEIASWPVAGVLVSRVGTLFIERGRRHAVHAMIERIEAKLREQAVLLVFPEGTTNDGRTLLPFHANLLQPAVKAQAAVVPAGIRYRGPDGTFPSEVAFVGEITFVASMWQVLGMRGLIAELHWIAPIEPDPAHTRHALAEQARAAIAERLALPTAEPVSRASPRP